MNIQSIMEKEWDLIVVGGGLTGVAAAVAARRHGLSVLILEKAGFLGGAASTQLVNPFMPFSTKLDGEDFVLSRGFFSELLDLLSEIGGMIPGHREIHEEYLKHVLDRLIIREKIQAIFHVMLCGVEKEGETIKAVKMATKQGIEVFKAKCFIDSTGDADLAVAAGCPYHLGRYDGLCQPMTLCFRIGGVDIPTFLAHKKEINEKYKRFQAEGKIKNPRENILAFRTLIDNVLHFNTTRIVKMNPTDPLDVTKAEMLAREQMFEVYNFLKKECPGFETCYLLYSAGEIGVRESRMIDGEYVLTENDIKDCTIFDDAIAAGNYSIDIHNPEGTGTSIYTIPAGKWYTIPYRSMLPKKVDNLLVAGRCISSVHEAQASYRVMPIVTTLGEAAGVAASISINDNVGVKHVDIKKLQRLLMEEGAFLGYR